MSNERDRLDTLALKSEKERQKKQVNMLEAANDSLIQEIEEIRQVKEFEDFTQVGPVKLPNGSFTVGCAAVALGICNSFVPLSSTGYAFTLVCGGVGGFLGRKLEVRLQDIESEE